ncbi:MAG: hypothetical protein ABSH12_03600 [Endomicrobiales bacterium]
MITPQYVGLLLVSIASMLIQIALTRLFSVAMWYHLSFMVVSIAMLGFGASGSLFAISSRMRAWKPSVLGTVCSVSFSVLALISLACVLLLRLDPFSMMGNYTEVIKLIILSIVLTAVFAASGSCTIGLFASFPAQVGRVYATTFIGSALGCVLVVELVPLLSNVGTVIFSAALGILAGASFLLPDKRRAVIALICSIALGCGAFISKGHIRGKIAESKGMSYMMQCGRKPFDTRWNVFSQVDVVDTRGKLAYGPGFDWFLHIPIPKQMSIYIDADAVTPITFPDVHGSADFLVQVPSSLPYQLKPRSRTCIIGSGGGFDVLIASIVGLAPSITAVEINPMVIEMARRYSPPGFDVYGWNTVHLVCSDGRSYLQHASQRYDIIQMSLVDTWAASANNAFALTENYLYTTEACSQAIDHLSSDGIFTVTRWITNPPNETLKLVAMMRAALRHQGCEHPEMNISVIGGANVMVVMVKKTGFTRLETEAITSLCSKRGFSVLYDPYISHRDMLDAVIRSSDQEAVFAAFPFDIRPAVDDKPFFFQTAKWKNLRKIVSDLHVAGMDRNFIGPIILITVLCVCTLLSGMLMIVPLFLSKAILPAVQKSLAIPAALAGAGFMFFEISSMQKCILALGHPVYSFSVVLFSLLASAGLGSNLVRCVDDRNVRQWLFNVLVVLALLMLILSVFIPAITVAVLGTALPVRVACVVVICAVPGFFMGMPLAMVIRLAARDNPRAIPWYWAINGCFSVLSSIVSVIISMNLGFTMVIVCAAMIYIIAALFIRPVRSFSSTSGNSDAQTL